MATRNKIYIDSCCLIESLKGDLGKEDPARVSGLDMLKRLLLAARDDKIIAFTSLLTVAEVVKAGDAPIDDEIKRKIERLILSGQDGLTTIGISPSIVLKARDLAWDDGLSSVKGADRLHLAAAIVAGAKEFLSWDNKLGKKLKRNEFKGLRLVEPSSSIMLPEEYKVDDLFRRR